MLAVARQVHLDGLRVEGEANIKGTLITSNVLTRGTIQAGNANITGNILANVGNITTGISNSQVVYSKSGNLVGSSGFTYGVLMSGNAAVP